MMFRVQVDVPSDELSQEIADAIEAIIEAHCANTEVFVIPLDGDDLEVLEEDR